MIWTMFRMTLAIIIGIVYLPLNMLLLKIGDMYQERKKDHLVEYWIIRIIIFPIWIITTIVSVPYEMLVEGVGH